MKTFLPLAVALFALSTELVNADSQTERIRKAAQEKSAALAAGNYGRVVDSTYPKLVEMIGGRDKMIETLRHGGQMRREIRRQKNNYRVATWPTAGPFETTASPKRTCFAAFLRCSSSKCPYTLPTRIPPSL